MLISVLSSESPEETGENEPKRRESVLDSAIKEMGKEEQEKNEDLSAQVQLSDQTDHVEESKEEQIKEADLVVQEKVGPLEQVELAGQTDHVEEDKGEKALETIPVKQDQLNREEQSNNEEPKVDLVEQDRDGIELQSLKASTPNQRSRFVQLESSSLDIKEERWTLETVPEAKPWSFVQFVDDQASDHQRRIFLIATSNISDPSSYSPSKSSTVEASPFKLAIRDLGIWFFNALYKTPVKSGFLPILFAVHLPPDSEPSSIAFTQPDVLAIGYDSVSNFASRPRRFRKRASPENNYTMKKLRLYVGYSTGKSLGVPFTDQDLQYKDKVHFEPLDQVTGIIPTGRLDAVIGYKSPGSINKSVTLRLSSFMLNLLSFLDQYDIIEAEILGVPLYQVQTVKMTQKDYEKTLWNRLANEENIDPDF
jgi:hypothetical protein